MSVYCLTLLRDNGLSIRQLLRSFINIDKTIYGQSTALRFIDKTSFWKRVNIYKSIYLFEQCRFEVLYLTS